MGQQGSRRDLNREPEPEPDRASMKAVARVLWRGGGTQQFEAIAVGGLPVLNLVVGIALEQVPTGY